MSFISFIRILSIFLLIQLTLGKIVWKIRPQPYQLARENENVKLNCEFENISPLTSLTNFFVIWYKDGSSQNVLSLNDQLANPNNSNYEIIGKYSLLIKNVTRNDSGQYTCQLFQSNDLVATVNLTVLVPPKYAKINVKQTRENYVINKGYFIENDLINLECCTNEDINPQPRFEWSKVSRNNKLQSIVISTSSNQHTNYDVVKNSKNQLCNSLQLNLTRQDNNYYFKCSVTNDALLNSKKEDSFFVSVEYKPEVKLHLKDKPTNVNKLTISEETSIVLYCNTTALPTVTSYEWFLNEQLITSRNTEVLHLNNVNRNHAGNYSCKSTNRHGSTNDYFNIDVIYAQLTPMNKSSLFRKLKLKDSVYLMSNENASTTLQCEIKSYPQIDNLVWYFYQVNTTSHLIQKIRLSNWISSIKTVLNQTEKRYYSQLNLNNLTSENTGYYSCSIDQTFTDDLNQTNRFNLNSTYFLQVKYSPEITIQKTTIYANNYDQIELKCQIKSNPISSITWYFENKEIFSNYKYNLSLNQIKQIDENEFSDLDNTHLVESLLTINSLTQYDYGEYMCRASNQIGTKFKLIRLNKKRKPDIPSEFKLVDSTSNSAQLSWRPPEYTGENVTYVININQTTNLTSVDSDESESSTSIMIAELKGLQSETEYAIKVLAFNSLGSSEFSNTLRIRTLKTALKPEQIPKIQIAKFSDIREAICFNLEHSEYNSQIRSLRDLVIRVDIKSNDLNETETDSIRTLLVNMNRLKLGQNCISYKQLVELNLLLLKSSSLQESQGNANKKIVYSLTTPNHNQMLTASSLKSFDSIGKSFSEFKRSNLINISVCYSNDSSVCTEQQSVIDNSSDISNYVTLVAIGCSAVFIFIILLISSLCCCCCRTRNREKKIAKTNGKIKGFPIVIPSNQQQQQKKNNFDYADDCIKSSQQHILNGSSSSSTSSSSSSTSSSTKNYYITKPNIIEQNLYDPNVQKYMTNSYKLEYPQNTSSIATVESDVSSSISLENNNNHKSKTSDLTTSHSPFAVITDSNKSGFASIASSSYSNMISSHNKPQQPNSKPVASSTLVYNGSGNMYIKTYQAQQSQSSSQYFNPKNILDNESAYSTPNNTTTVSKKLVYEVIV